MGGVILSHGVVGGVVYYHTCITGRVVLSHSVLGGVLSYLTCCVGCVILSHVSYGVCYLITRVIRGVLYYHTCDTGCVIISHSALRGVLPYHTVSYGGCYLITRCDTGGVILSHALYGRGYYLITRGIRGVLPYQTCHTVVRWLGVDAAVEGQRRMVCPGAPLAWQRCVPLPFGGGCIWEVRKHWFGRAVFFDESGPRGRREAGGAMISTSSDDGQRWD